MQHADKRNRKETRDDMTYLVRAPAGCRYSVILPKQGSDLVQSPCRPLFWKVKGSPKLTRAVCIEDKGQDVYPQTPARILLTMVREDYGITM